LSRIQGNPKGADSLSGAAGPALAAWLTGQGIDASLRRINGLEDWVIVFNSAVVERVQHMPAAEIDMAIRNLPKIDDQIAMALATESDEDEERQAPAFA
jgi:hypothetical protein